MVNLNSTDEMRGWDSEQLWDHDRWQHYTPSVRAVQRRAGAISVHLDIADRSRKAAAEGYHVEQNRRDADFHYARAAELMNGSL